MTGLLLYLLSQLANPKKELVRPEAELWLLFNLQILLIDRVLQKSLFRASNWRGRKPTERSLI
jgi:hypothetical protein